MAPHTFAPTVPVNFRLPLDLRTRLDAEARAASPTGKPRLQLVGTALLTEALDARDKNRAAVEAAQLKLSLATPAELPIKESRRAVAGQAVPLAKRKAHTAARKKAAKPAARRAVPARKGSR